MSQPTDHGKSLSNYDSVRAQNIREFHDRFYIKPLLTLRSLSLELTDEKKQVDNILYKPSSNTFLGLGLYMFDIGLELSLKVPQDVNTTPPSIYGETKSFDFQSNIYAKKWGADLAYQKYTELYMDKPANHFNNWKQGDPYPVRSDLSLKYIQANLFYILNHKKFSYRSPYIQADQQLHSKGSFQLGVFVSSFRFEADSTLIPQSAAASFPNTRNIDRARITTLAFLPGYTFTLTAKKLYLNAALALGPGNLWTRYDTEDQENNEIGIRPVFNVRGALGYNGDWFFTGITAYNQVVSARIDNLNVNTHSAHLKIFVGVRFREKGVMTKSLFGS